MAAFAKLVKQQQQGNSLLVEPPPPSPAQLARWAPSPPIAPPPALVAVGSPRGRRAFNSPLPRRALRPGTAPGPPEMAFGRVAKQKAVVEPHLVGGALGTLLDSTLPSALALYA